MFFIGIIAAINILLWIFFVPWLIGRKLTNFQSELISKYYDEVEIMYRKTRGWRHDYHNHIQVLKAHMDMGEYEEVKDYLDTLENDLTTVDTVIKTGNVMVDAILNSKLSLMKEKEIAADATAIVPRSLNISGTDLSVLIGNMLDNAIEACEKLPKEERMIRIYMDVIKKQLYIAVTNSMSGKAKRAGKYFSTTKAAGHGYGIYSIDNIVSRNNGYINRQTEEGVFATEVMLPLTK